MSKSARNFLQKTCLLSVLLALMVSTASAAVSTRVDGTPTPSGADTPQDVLEGPVPDELVVNFQGLDWVWASPCIHGGCSDPDPANQAGWRYATDEELLNRPACEAFQREDLSTRCASPYFDPTYTHCDYFDCEAGAVASSEGQICYQGEANGGCESWYVSGELVEGAATARFNVTKTFDDGNTADVEVTLTCNSGLPLQQSFTITGGDPVGVTFVVTDFEQGTMDCAVTETGSPDGYTVSYNGCEWAGVVSGAYTCEVVNEAIPATFTVNKEWIISEEGGGDVVDRVAEVVITCDRFILNGDMPPLEEQPMPYLDWTLTGIIVGDDSLEAIVNTSNGPATCSAEEVSEQSGVEISSDCDARLIPAGGTSECTITNTVFFEGIPALSQYGKAVLVLILLGVGFIGFRRFV